MHAVLTVHAALRTAGVDPASLVALDFGAGISALLRRMSREGVVRELARTRYTHRRSVTGEALPYVAVIARKQRDIPPDWLD